MNWAKAWKGQAKRWLIARDTQASLAGDLTVDLYDAETRAKRAEKRLARAEELLRAAEGHIRCNMDGECYGCALEADIEMFLEGK